MQLDFEEGNYENIVNNYMLAKEVLEEYGDQGVFKMVAVEVRLVIEEVAVKLEEQLNTMQSGSPEFCVGLLRKIGREDTYLQVIIKN